MIMIPVLILQIFLFPIVASSIMDNWSTAQRTLELQQNAGHLSSTIQQLYYTVNRIDEDCQMNLHLDIEQPEQYAYTVTLWHVNAPETSYKIMNVSLSAAGTRSSAFSLVTLGSEVNWADGLHFSSTDGSVDLYASRVGGVITLTLETD
jgi:hypothetical protein